MSTPALIYLALMVLGLGLVIAKHGEPRTGNYSLWQQLFATAVACGLLYWGGFFDRVAA